MSDYGIVTEQTIKNIPKIYSSLSLEKYVVMPNHFHMLLLIQRDDGSTLCSPTISMVVKQLKEHITKQVGVKLWQKSFHDHIIRDERDYSAIWEYIDTNPAKWTSDCFYCE